jgi:hypothetical protein
MPNYIPSTDSDLSLFADQFGAYCTGNYASLGMTGAQADDLADLVQIFDAALALARAPETKTKATVAAKDAAKANMLLSLRYWAQLIKTSPGISNEVKATLGLNIDDKQPTPVPAPSTTPLISIVGAIPLSHSLRFADSATPDKRSKPAGAILLELRCSVGTVEPQDIDAVPLRALYSRNPVTVTFDGDDVGKTAWYYARWVTKTGLVGPWSSLVSFTVAG